jgi:hypothetical protein
VTGLPALLKIGQAALRLAAVMMCDRCDTGGWIWPPRPEVTPDDDFEPRSPIRCLHAEESA